VRLAFSVAASVDPDVLLIDEALSVGDEHFRGKCLNRLNEFREQGRTIVFVSHDIGTVKNMCQAVVLLDRGEVVAQGSAEKVSDEYLKRAHARGNERMSALRGASEYPRWGSGEIEVTEVHMLDAAERPTLVFRTGEPFTVRLSWAATQDCARPVFGLGIYRSDGTYVNGSNHQWRDEPIELQAVRAGEEGTVELRFDAMPLLQGEYYLTSFLYDHAKASPTAIDHREHVATFQVLDPRRHQHGMLLLPARWTVRRERGPDGRPEVRESRS
jgi:ABC-type sugar transport system ATPase subunit